MINAVFTKKYGKLCGVRVCGHAGYADAGEDIVCAAVSSAVQLSANLITESFGLQADISTADSTVSIQLCRPDETGSRVLRGILLHLEYLSEDYPGTIRIQIMEV